MKFTFSITHHGSNCMHQTKDMDHRKPKQMLCGFCFPKNIFFRIEVYCYIT